MENNERSFVMYTNYLNPLEALNMEQRGKLFTAILCYVAGKPFPELDTLSNIAFSFIAGQIDRDYAKWEEVKRKRIEAGRKRGKARQGGTALNSVQQCSTRKDLLSSVEQEKTCSTAGTVNVDVNVNDNVNVNEDVNVNMGDTPGGSRRDSPPAAPAPPEKTTTETEQEETEVDRSIPAYVRNVW